MRKLDASMAAKKATAVGIKPIDAVSHPVDVMAARARATRAIRLDAGAGKSGALTRGVLTAGAGNCDDLWLAIPRHCRLTGHCTFLLWLVLSGLAQPFEYSLDRGAAPDTLTSI